MQILDNRGKLTKQLLRNNSFKIFFLDVILQNGCFCWVTKAKLLVVLNKFKTLEKD